MTEELKIVSNNEVKEFMMILKDLPADVALEALSQYPEFTQMILENDRALVTKVIDSNQENATQCFMFYQEILRDISLCLEDDSLNYEERLSLIDREIEIAQIIGKKETEIRELNRQLLGGR